MVNILLPPMPPMKMHPMPMYPPAYPLRENFHDDEGSHLSPRGCGIRRGVNEELARRNCERNQVGRSERSVNFNLTGDGMAEKANSSSNNDSSRSLMETRVVGGDTCNIIWPWMAAISNQGQYVCGGSVINNRHILTAAHCFDKRFLDPDQWKINVGTLVIENAQVDYEVEEIHLHKDYKPVPHLNHDIALMRLKTTLPPRIVPICLPVEDTLKEGDMATVIGWGKTAEGGDFADRLQELHGLKIIEKEDCNARLRTVDEHFKGLQEYQICAGGEEKGGKDACQGDSGGPLIRKQEDNSWIQEGIVSFGFGCARPGIPGLYTKVSHYTEWLDDFID